MSDLVLVHGDMQGAWCWDLPSDALAALGHRAIATDVPLEGSSAAMPEYVDAVVTAAAAARAAPANHDFVVGDLDEYRAHLRRRLRVEPVVLPGGHSPFLTHPAAPADVLHHFAAKDSAPAHAERRQ